MIGLRDTFTLALTKLRIRRVRLIITVVISGLLFSVLVFFSLTAHGLVRSLKDFMGQGLLNRYVVAVQSYGTQYEIDPAVIAKVKALEKAQIEAKKAEAKRLKLEYDATTEPSAVTSDAGTKLETVNITSPLYKQAVADLKLSDPFMQTLALDAAPYHIKSLSHGVQQYSSGSAQYSLTPIVGGAEVGSNAAKGTDTSDVLGNFSSSLQSVEGPMLDPFTLSGASLKSAAGSPVPVLLPLDAVEKILGKTKPGRQAKPAEQLAYVKDIRAAAVNATFQVCYRNAEAMALTQKAETQAKDRLANAKTAGWQAPALEYKVSTAPCQPVTVLRDARTAEQKATDAKQLQFDQKFGAQPAQTSTVSFKIVGILPRTFSADQSDSVLGFASIFLTSTLGYSAYMPAEAVKADPVLGPLYASGVNAAIANDSYYVEFPNREAQKAFTEAHGTCSPGNYDPAQPTDMYADCRAKHQYLGYPIGNPLATLADISDGVKRVKTIALGVLATLSGLIMMGTIGKIIADSRKETSVFRAVGAKRRDIAQIYLLFSALLAVGGLLVAIAIGVAGAAYVDQYSSQTLTVQSLLAFNSSDMSRTFHLFAFDLKDFVSLAAFVIGVGLAGALIPLISNLRRSPIKDMREE